MKHSIKKLPILLSALLLALSMGLLAGCDSSGLGDGNSESANFKTRTVYFQEGFDFGVPGAMTMYNANNPTFIWSSAAYGNPAPCAKMTAYQSSTNYADEDWLITPLIELPAGSCALLTFEEMIRFAGSLNDCQVLWSTTGDPTTPGDWTLLEAFYRDDNSNNYDFREVKVCLSSLAGSNIYIGFKYTSTTDYAATWEIDNIKVEDDGTPKIGYYGPNEQCRYYGGDGTVANSDPIRLSTTYGTESCSKCFDVQGCCLTEDIDVSILIYSNVFEVTPATLTASGGTICVKIKDDAPEGSYQDYIKLESSGVTILIPLRGTVYPANGATSFGVVTFDDFNSGLETDLEGFCIYDAGAVPGYTWVDASYGDPSPCAKMSAYSSGARADEDWLITPPIDVSSLASKQLTFTEAINYASAISTECQILYSTDYTCCCSDPNNATWNTLTGTPRASGSDWTFVDVTVDLSGIPAPQTNVRIAFKYTSTTASACTWEIDNVLIQ